MKIKIALHSILIAALMLLIVPSAAFAYTVNITVAKDGSGNFTTVQAALDSIPSNNSSRKIIYIKNGTYKEKIRVTKPYISLIGQSKDSTIITYDDHVDTSKSDAYNAETPTVIITGKDFTADTIKFENTAGQIERANAVKINADKAAFYSCRIIGGQDTLYLYPSGGQRAYFNTCTIEGDVDFIYGGMIGAFDHCEIRSNSGGYITAASTPQTQQYGFLFHGCTLTGTGSATTGSVYLGRPWRPYASVLFRNCTMGSHINLTGWNNWGNAANEATARFMEYENSGAGWDVSKRVPWTKILTGTQAASHTIINYMKGTDNWNPTSRPY